MTFPTRRDGDKRRGGMKEKKRQQQLCAAHNRRHRLVIIRCIVIIAMMSATVMSWVRFSSSRSNSFAMNNAIIISQQQRRNKQPTKSWDPAKCVVMGLAMGYTLPVYRTFVGSLRATGFPGQIHLGLAVDVPEDVRGYLSKQNVTTHPVKVAERCTYDGSPRDDGEPSKQTCFMEYPDYKMTWGRFLLYRDWLQSCGDGCRDGVMLTDVRDAYFQSDPFEAIKDDWNSLMVFEEIFPNITTEHWLTNIPVTKCRNYTLGKRPMLCSGSVMGSRQGILDYIFAMKREFDYWKTRANCRSDMKGDDQSIHNYVYYSGELSDIDTKSFQHRTGPIHVVGFQANTIFRAAIKKAHEGMGIGTDLSQAESWVNAHGYFGYEKGNRHEWLPPEYNLIDPKTGFVTNLDGKPSPQVHQHDRFGLPINVWLDRMSEEWHKGK